MSITIDNPEAEGLVAELSTRMARRPDDLLRRERARLEGGIEQAREATRKLQAAWVSLPIVDGRPFDRVVEYDEHGLPV